MRVKGEKMARIGFPPGAGHIRRARNFLEMVRRNVGKDTINVSYTKSKEGLQEVIAVSQNGWWVNIKKYPTRGYLIQGGGVVKGETLEIYSHDTGYGVIFCSFVSKLWSIFTQ